MGVQLGVALLVALERGSRAVVAPAVELDGESVLGPVGVDLEAVELRVGERAREAVAVAEVEEGGFEVAAGVLSLVSREVSDPLRAGSTGAYGQQRGDVEQAVVLGGLDGAGELRPAGGAGEVGERAVRAW